MARKTIARGFLLAAVSVCLVAEASAQQVPSAARPVVAPEALSAPQTGSAPGLDLAASPAGQAPAGAETVTFTLSGIEVEGSTVYDAQQLSSFFADKIGTTVSLSDVFTVAAAMEAAYRADGYFLTRVVVPAQRIEGGSVKLLVVEGYIHSVAVVGDAGGSLDLVTEMAREIEKEGGPARLATVERQLLMINQIPGLSARGVLGAVAGERGASQLTVEVRRKPVSGFVSFDNRGSEWLGPWGVTASAGLNSATGLGERVDLTVFSSIFSDHQRMVQVSGDVALGSGGLRLHGYAGYSDGNPGGALSLIDIETEAKRFGFGLDYPILLGRRASLKATAAFDWLDEDDDLLGFTNTRDRLRVLRLLADGEYRDTLAGVTRANLGAHFGLDLFGASQSGDDHLSRAGADGSFAKFTLEVSRLQRLFSVGFGTLNLQLEAAGQYAPEALLADEEFRLGGYRFGRGYAPGEISGDRAMAGSAELQFDGVIDSSDEAGRFHLPYQLYAFYEAGKTFDEEGPSQALTSAGGGARLYIGDSIQSEIEVAKPLTRDRGDRSDDPRRPAIFFRLVGSF